MDLILDELTVGGRFDFIVLHATKGAVEFYERRGFCRVGATARYVRDAQSLASVPVVGYRHWTYADQLVSKMARGAPAACVCTALGRSKKRVRAARL